METHKIKDLKSVNLSHALETQSEFNMTWCLIEQVQNPLSVSNMASDPLTANTVSNHYLCPGFKT